MPAAFPGNTLGGEVKFEVDFYVDTWLAGKSTTGWMANDDEHVSQLDLYLVQYPVPLDKNSLYKHSHLLIYQEGRYDWLVTPVAPKGTIANRNTSPTGNNIGDWTGLTASQRYGMLGMAWEAAGMGITSCTGGAGGQLYAMQNIDIPGTPMNSVKFPSCGFEGPTRLIYDPYPPEFLKKDGQWVLNSQGQPVPDPKDVLLGEYYIDPRSASIPYDEGGGYDDKGQPSPWLYLSDAPDDYYLDIAAVGDEKMTYIYVLYYRGDGAQPSQYHMAIYQYGTSKPEGNPLTRLISTW